MHSVRVHTTSSTAHRQRTTGRAGIARVAQAPRAVRPAPAIGWCTACGSIEVVLNAITGTRDFSHLGESDAYPTGYGCELCD